MALLVFVRHALRGLNHTCQHDASASDSWWYHGAIVEDAAGSWGFEQESSEYVTQWSPSAGNAGGPGERYFGKHYELKTNPDGSKSPADKTHRSEP